MNLLPCCIEFANLGSELYFEVCLLQWICFFPTTNFKFFQNCPWDFDESLQVNSNDIWNFGHAKFMLQVSSGVRSIVRKRTNLTFYSNYFSFLLLSRKLDLTTLLLRGNTSKPKANVVFKTNSQSQTHLLTLDSVFVRNSRFCCSVATTWRNCAERLFGAVMFG